MKPSIGRIVWYRPTENDHIAAHGNHQEILPAVIVHVWTDSCVNLKVLTDAPADIWKTSVVLGKDTGQWCWPQREA